MYDFSFLFLLSFSFIFHVNYRNSSPSYTCINQGHLVFYKVSIWVISSLSQHLSKVLKLAPLQPSRYWLHCHFLLDHLLSPLCCNIWVASGAEPKPYHVTKQWEEQLAWNEEEQAAHDIEVFFPDSDSSSTDADNYVPRHESWPVTPNGHLTLTQDPSVSMQHVFTSRAVTSPSSFGQPQWLTLSVPVPKTPNRQPTPQKPIVH